jgi:hypothetical protein
MSHFEPDIRVQTWLSEGGKGEVNLLIVQNTTVKQLLSTSGDQNLGTEFILPVIQEGKLTRSVKLVSVIGNLLSETMDISSSRGISRSMS